jgi:hypothetical protein
VLSVKKSLFDVLSQKAEDGMGDFRPVSLEIVESAFTDFPGNPGIPLRNSMGAEMAGHDQRKIVGLHSGFPSPEANIHVLIIHKIAIIKIIYFLQESFSDHHKGACNPVTFGNPVISP